MDATRMQRITAVLCNVVLLLAAACGGGESTGTVAPPTVAAVTVTLANGTLSVGQTAQAEAQVKDASGNVLSGRSITWTSSASTVALVSASGLISGVAGGSATITATSEGVAGTVSVAVQAPVASILVSGGAASIAAGSTTQYSATVRDASNTVLTGRAVIWTSSNNAIAIVSTSGLVTGVSVGGPVTITATSEGQSGNANITVTQVPVASVSISLATTSVAAGGSTAATAVIRDAAGNALAGRIVTWSSSNQGVGTFDVAGTVTALAPGTSTITATSEGQSGSAVLTVTPGAANSAPFATAVGTPAGTASTLTIGPAGGTVASADGQLTVIIPANALTTSVAITIQPITNEAPGGLGQGYQLLPEGQTFVAPVQLVFRISDEELAGTSPDVLAVATQESTGFWRKLMSGTYSASNKTLTVTTTHFSGWGLLAGFLLVPGSAGVPVQGSLSLSALDCPTVAIPGTNGQTRLGRCVSGNFTVNTWTVNSTPGGTPTYGTVVGGSLGATYVAPSEVPSLNPVTVGVSVDAGLRTGGRATLQLASNVLIYADSWTGTAQSILGGVLTPQTSTATITWGLQS
ncbi:MAG: Ig-like domain-containing protein, partial [Gemmatimonas sp.]